MTGLTTSKIDEMNEEEREKVALDYILGEKQNDSEKCISTSWLFFLEPHNSISAFSVLNPEEYKRNFLTHKIKGESRAKLNNNTINKCYKLWTRTCFFDKDYIIRPSTRKKQKSRGKSKTIIVYKLNINSFFKYAENKGFQFTPEQKKILEVIFSPDQVRKSMYQEYSEISFLDAMIKYYVRFYVYFLRNNKKNKKEHYLEKEFLDYIIFSKPLDFRKDEKEFSVKKSSKIDKILDRNHLKYQHYLSPGKLLVYGLRPLETKGRKPELKFSPGGNYYSVYHSLHHFYENIMNDLDEKILGMLLHGVPKKIS